MGVPAGAGPGQGSLPGWRAAISCCVLTWRGAGVQKALSSALLSLGLIPSRRPHPMTSSNRNHLPEAPPPDTITAPNPCSPLTPSALPTCPYPAPRIHPAPVCKGAPGHVHSPDVSCEPQANVSIYLLHAPKWMSHKYPKGDMSRMDSSNSLPTFL